MKRLVSALIMVTALAGCSIGTGVQNTAIEEGGKILAAMIKDRKAEGPEAALAADVNVAKAIRPKDYAALAKGSILVHAESRKSWAILVKVTSNRGDTTYFTPDRVGLTLRGLVLRSSRGLGGDLFASSPAPLLNGIAAGGARYSKTYQYLAPDTTLTPVELRCSVISVGADNFELAGSLVKARAYDETCDGIAPAFLGGEDIAFTNRFWVENGGNIRRARAWVSPKVGYLDIYALQ